MRAGTQACWLRIQALFMAPDFPRSSLNPAEQLEPVMSTFSSKGPELGSCSQ